MSNKIINTKKWFSKPEKVGSKIEIETVSANNENTSLTSYLTRISNAQFGVVIEELF